MSAALERLGTVKEFKPTMPSDNGDPMPPPFAEDTLALEFADRFAADLRFVAAWGRWYRWDGLRWAPDKTLHAFDLARVVAREAADRCPAETKAVGLASARVVAAIERLARSDRRIAATVEQWDADPFALNTPAGVVDLRTGRIEPAKRDAYATKITRVAPDGDCPVWHAHLARIFKADGEMIGYARRFCGYALTGDIREHAFAYGHGTGANGKSRFIEAVTWAMGDYAMTAPVETFTATNSDKHPTELARLRGARLVTASETEKGRRWAESRIKQLTGGDRVAARFMRQDFFEFSPAFKLFIVGNHKPSLRTVDEAIRRRLHLWPFEVTIPPAERDLELEQKLQREAGGILRWMIQGCLEWQREGLKPPPAVIAATDAYFADEDSFGTWLDECCERRGFQYRETSSRLFASWKKWATENGEDAGSQKAFSGELEKRGFDKLKAVGVVNFVGIYLRPVYANDEAGP